MCGLFCMQTFNETVHSQTSQLNVRWRRIERLLKKAERLQEAVAIAAINELRYAGRQLFEISAYFTRGTPLKSEEKRSVNRRLIIADQYLRNAEHDIADAIVRYLLKVTREANEQLGKAKISEYYNEYPLFMKSVTRCFDLIEESREFSEKRFENYHEIYSKHFDYMIECYTFFLDAEVSARFRMEELQYEIDVARFNIETLDIEKKKTDKLNKQLAIFGAIAGMLAILAIPLTVYIWKYPPTEMCPAPGNVLERVLCAI